MQYHGDDFDGRLGRDVLNYLRKQGIDSEKWHTVTLTVCGGSDNAVLLDLLTVEDTNGNAVQFIGNDLKPPKEWTFTVTIRGGNDEFWESKPSRKEVADEVKATLMNNGFFNINVK